MVEMWHIDAHAVRLEPHACNFCGACFSELPLLAVNVGCPYCGGTLEPIEGQEPT